MSGLTKDSLGRLAFKAFIVLIFATPLWGFYFYYVAKDYDYVIETPCDSTGEKCFQRYCSITDECPPNALSVYKKYFIKASDFAKCTDNSCTNICESKQGICRPIMCGADPTDICTDYESR